MAHKSIRDIFDLSGKGAVVTGAARGIGEAIAVRLAEAGASVLVTDILMDEARQTVEQIEAAGGTAKAMYADVRDIGTAEAVVREAVASFGSLDVLVNNAAVYPVCRVLDITEEIWDDTLNTNLKGSFFYAQAAAREMVRAGHGGKIINLASIDAVKPLGEVAHYNASKGGVVMVTKALALELGPHGIAVNCIAPGSIWTPGQEAVGQAVVASGRDVRELLKKMKGRRPLGRIGDPDDIARVALFLASSASDYMTGGMVLADGGYLLT